MRGGRGAFRRDTKSCSPTQVVYSFSVGLLPTSGSSRVDPTTLPIAPQKCEQNDSRLEVVTCFHFAQAKDDAVAALHVRHIYTCTCVPAICMQQLSAAERSVFCSPFSRAFSRFAFAARFPLARLRSGLLTARFAAAIGLYKSSAAASRGKLVTSLYFEKGRQK